MPGWIRKCLRAVLLGVVTFLLLVMGADIWYRPNKAKRLDTTDVVRRGFDIAQRCVPTPSVQLDHVELYSVPGKSFTVFWHPGRFIGYTFTLGFDKRVYVAEGSINDQYVWAHEFLHIFGILGHPTSEFERCHLN